MKVTKLAAAALAVSMFAAMPASAKTVTAGASYEKAKTVKKGTTSVKLNSKLAGYLKFKAPKAGTYKFKFNNVRCSGSFQNVYATAYLRSGKYHETLYYKQNGQRVSSLALTTSRNWSNRTDKTKKAYTSIPSRTASVKLKKNQIVYIYFHAASSGKKVYYDLTIK